MIDAPDNEGRPGRRDFIARAAAVIAAATIAPRDAGAHVAPPQSDSPPAAASANAFEFEEVDLTELKEGMAAGKWTSRSLVSGYLDRIAQIDRNGPTINSVLEVNPDALEIADELDAEYSVRGPRGPLHGIPILVKDNVGTADKMHTSAGSLALAHSIAPRDAFIVERLRAAGCVILGKSNMSEWSNARGRAAIGGWSGRGRLTRNPYALDRSPGGSSSGTAAAVSANLVAAAVGTETMGSIMSPAALSGIVGLKPTVGLVSRAGIIPVSYTQDSAGPMCRSVRDAAIMLNALAGMDPRDPATSSAGGKIARDYTAFLDPAGLKGARIGVARSLFGVSYLSDRIVERGLEAIKAAGAKIVDPADIETANAIWPFDAEVLAHELKASLNEYLASLGPSAPVKSLAELIAFNDANSDREMRWFGQETFVYAEHAGPLTSPAYQQALAMTRRLSRDQGIDATLAKHSLDAIIAPTQSPAWLIDLLLGDNGELGSFVTSCAAGYPTITVPAGDVAGLPVGLMFMGAAWSEPKLIRYAFAFEQLVQARRPPLFLRSVDVRP